MNASTGLKTCLALLLIVGTVAWSLGSGASCGTAPTPFVVQGLAPTGNTPPTLEISEPSASLTRGRGEPFPISWTDSDRDSNALIAFALVNTLTNEVIPLVDNIPENDDVGPDTITVQTSLIPIGTYHIRGTIDDGVNLPVSIFATDIASTLSQRVSLLLVEPGQGPPTNPPTVAITEPSFNLSVAQDDVLRVVVQPTLFAPAGALPFDSDSDITLFVLLDVDREPNNDDPANPDPTKIIVLRQQTVTAQSFDAITFEIDVDLNEIPPRPGGEPYFIRATADDASNPRVHQYAVGTISVVELAAGAVDLFDIGRSKSGTRIYGFSPGANVGSNVSHVGDFDADGVDDFAVVAQFGNPRNFGLLGEAYLIYGRADVRFGGSVAANTVSETVDGVIFEAPPVRTRVCPGSDARTDGITDVSFIRDLSGDGRPELLFGLPHVHCAFESMDFDPGDDDVAGEDNTADVSVAVRQGRAAVTVDDEEESPNFLYSGVSDVVISSAQPNTSFGSSAELSWVDDGAQQEWTLIKLADVLDEIPDSPASIEAGSVQATLRLRIFNIGGSGTIHECLTPFTTQTTFATFASGGGAPEPGVDYVVTGEGQAGGLATIDGGAAEFVDVEVSDLVRRLIDGDLPDEANDELRFIIVPDPADGADRTAFRSSEYGIQDDRPLLTINYTRTNFLGALGCYPDPFVNNVSDDETQDPFDLQYYAGGMGVIVNSENRDNDPRLADPPARLATTSIALELVGQQAGWVLTRDEFDETQGGGIFARAEGPAEEDRIAGARFVAGPYDFEDHLFLRQPPKEGLFGQAVASIGDLNNDGLDEIVFSAPRNERHLQDLFDAHSSQSTHWRSSGYRGSITIIPGADYNLSFWRDSATNGTSNNPTLDQQRFPPHGSCTQGIPRELLIPADSFEVFAEELDDFLGDGQSAGDFNQDGVEDILCGAPRNDRSASLPDSGAVYILYGRNVLSDIDLTKAEDPLLRPPLLRVRGVKPGDQIGWSQAPGLDVDGDRLSDVFLSSPTTDFGGVSRAACARDFDGDGTVDSADLDDGSFNACRDSVGEEVFSDDACKVFDYDNDRDIDGADAIVFTCLSDGGTNCCANLVDNGFVGVIFGGVFTDGDRTIDQIATSDLPGAIFFGAAAGHRAGFSVSSAGDFNQDGFGDILVTAPGESRLDLAGRERLGVVYLIFGGTHLKNTRWNLAQVGTRDLPGIVFLSPYVKGRPNEAAPTTVGFIGDINNDGFGDVAIGNPQADFIDQNFPQGPDATDSQLGRRRNAGDLYIVYGNNFGSNRLTP